MNILLGRILLLKGGLSRREVVAVKACGHTMLRLEGLIGIVGLIEGRGPLAGGRLCPRHL